MEIRLTTSAWDLGSAACLAATAPGASRKRHALYGLPLTGSGSMQITAMSAYSTREQAKTYSAGSLH